MIELYNMIIAGVIRTLAAVIGLVLVTIFVPWLTNTAIPWLKEKRLYDLCFKFVLAAEKRAEAGSLLKQNKKAFVIDMLRRKGVIVTEDVDALIECAVEELDLMIESGLIFLGDIFEDAYVGEEEIEDDDLDFTMIPPAEDA